MQNKDWEDYQAQLLARSLEMMNSRDASLCILNYLKDVVPFEHALCYTTNRNTQVMRIVAEYTPKTSTRFVEHEPYKTHSMLPWEAIKNPLRGGDNGISLMKDTSETRFVEYLRTYPFSVKSSIAVYLDRNEEENYVSLVLFVHGEPGVLNEAHQDILAKLQEPVVSTLRRLLEDNQNSLVHLTEDGSVHA